MKRFLAAVEEASGGEKTPDSEIRDMHAQMIPNPAISFPSRAPVMGADGFEQCFFRFRREGDSFGGREIEGRYDRRDLSRIYRSTVETVYDIDLVGAVSALKRYFPSPVISSKF